MSVYRTLGRRTEQRYAWFYLCGNPVACAGALSVLERVSDETFLQEVKAKGEYMQQKLSEMEGVAEARGIGMMIGIVLEKEQPKM